MRARGHQDVVRMRQDGVRTASGWRQEGAGMVHVCVRNASGWRQDGVRMTSGRRQGSVRQASG